MKRSYLSKIAVLLFAVLMTVTALSGCRMKLPDTKGIGPGAKDEQEDTAEEEYEEGEYEEMFVDEDALSNQDVTAGTIEDEYYSASAYINDATYVYVDAPEVVLKDQNPAKPAKVKDKNGDLKKARLAYLTNYYEGDEASAKEDLEDYETAEFTDAQRKELKGLYDELGKIFAQFDIVNYDFTAPTEADDEFAEFDVYSSDNEPFLVDLTFDNGKITDVNISYDGDL